jgi:hypothetical protein
MTEYRKNIQTILTTLTDNFGDRVLLFGQMTIEKEKPTLQQKPKSHFFSSLCLAVRNL